jgi:hypothetical protein
MRGVFILGGRLGRAKSDRELQNIGEASSVLYLGSRSGVLFTMGNESNVDRVAELLKDATGLAKSHLKLRGEGVADAMVIVELAKLLGGGREKKVLSGGTPTRPDPVQEARKTPRKPFVAGRPAEAKKKAPARKR